MDKETAIKILDHRTYKETISQFESYEGFTGEQAKALAVLDACEMAISALRAQPSPANFRICPICGHPLIEEARNKLKKQ